MAKAKRKTAKRAAKRTVKKSSKRAVRKPVKRSPRKVAKRAAPRKAAKKAAKKAAPAKGPHKTAAPKPPRPPAPPPAASPEAEEAAEAPLLVSEAYPGELTVDEDPLAESREIFNRYDRDGSGTIERGEFARLLEALGGEPSEEEVAAGLQVVDANHSGRISWTEFEGWWSSH